MKSNTAAGGEGTHLGSQRVSQIVELLAEVFLVDRRLLLADLFRKSLERCVGTLPSMVRSRMRPMIVFLPSTLSSLARRSAVTSTKSKQPRQLVLPVEPEQVRDSTLRLFKTIGFVTLP